MIPTAIVTATIATMAVTDALMRSIEAKTDLRRRGRGPPGSPGRWKRLARQPLVAIGGVVHERRDDDRVLHHVLRLDPFVQIHVRVMRVTAVFHRVLDELEAREPDLVERDVI